MANKVEVFGSILCPYCHQAKVFLKRHKIAFVWKEVLMFAGMKFPTKNFKEMKRRSKGETTVPQIFVDGKHYGDEDTLVADERQGRLNSVFRQAKVCIHKKTASISGSGFEN